MRLRRIFVAQEARGVEFVVDSGKQAIHPASLALWEVARAIAATLVTGS